MTARIVLLPGDGIGPEVIAATQSVLQALATKHNTAFEFSTHLVGGAAIDDGGHPFPDATKAACQSADAVLLGAVGGPQWNDVAPHLRPEQGLLSMRKAMGVFANLRPARALPALAHASPLKIDRLTGVDLMVVRELTGGIYFGEKIEGDEIASDLCTYTAVEVERVVRLAANMARQRRNKLTLVDKANVLATSRLWRTVTSRIMKEADFAGVDFDIVLVDAAAMMLVTNPARFDVIVTENMFGDILTDECAAVFGSLGMLPSASLSFEGPGLYEPIHGSAPDIAGQNKANPFGTLLSAAMALEMSLNLPELAADLRRAVEDCVTAGETTVDLGGTLGTTQAAECVVQRLCELAPA